MNITWNITKLACYPQYDSQQNVVVYAAWNCIGQEGYFESVENGVCQFTLDPNKPYIPYQDLTQDIVLNWIWSSGVDKEQTEELVVHNVNVQINPPIVETPLPW